MNSSTSSPPCDGLSPVDDPRDDWLLLSAASDAGVQNLEADDRGKLKSKLVSAWNSVKYGLLLYFFKKLLILIFSI